MHFSSFLFAASASAFPFAAEQLVQRQAPSPEETNCGPLPCLTFDAKDQYVDVSQGSGHEYVEPQPSDQRGPCPGLNAAANHAFLPRSGIINVQQTVQGLAEAFNMGADIAAGLAAIAILLDGSPITLTWSIGGAYKDPISLIGQEPQGISWSHNQYEGDSSVTREDAYLNNGDASTLIISRFEEFYNSAEHFTLASIRGQFAKNQAYSIANNPNYFSAQFSGLLVVPAAHNFIINFFSNHSIEYPSGRLDRETLKTFFGVTGEPGSFVAHQGRERIPENWYKRPTSNQYDLTKAITDVVNGYVQEPSTFKFGGNTGSPNSFVGVDIEDLTGGVFNSENLFEGNNFGCFLILAQQQDFPDSLKGLEGQASGIANLLKDNFLPILDKFACPKLEKYNQGLFNKFPGYKYRPEAPNPGGIGEGYTGA